MLATCSFHPTKVCYCQHLLFPGQEVLQQQAAAVLQARAARNWPETLLQTLQSTPSCLLLSWTLVPRVTSAVLPTDGTAPAASYALANADEQRRYHIPL